MAFSRENTRYDRIQFAKPIEDEDLFGSSQVAEPIESREEESASRLSEDEDAYSSNQNEEPIGSRLDEEFTFSEDEDPYGSNINESQNQFPPGLSKKEELKRKLLEQTRAKSLPKPKRFQANEDGNIELMIDDYKLVSCDRSKYIFAKMFNKNDKSPEKGSSGTKWDALSDKLRKEISSRKRKVWDSLQAPADNFDEEEEIVEPEPAKSDDEPEEEELDDEGDDYYDDNGDDDEDQSDKDQVLVEDNDVDDREDQEVDSGDGPESDSL